MAGIHNGLCAVGDNRFISKPGKYRSRCLGRTDDRARAGCYHWARTLGETRNQKRQDDAGHTARSRRNSGRRRGVEPWQRSRDVAPKSLRASRTDAGGRGGGYGCRRRGSI